MNGYIFPSGNWYSIDRQDGPVSAPYCHDPPPHFTVRPYFQVRLYLQSACDLPSFPCHCLLSDNFFLYFSWNSHFLKLNSGKILTCRANKITWAFNPNDLISSVRWSRGWRSEEQSFAWDEFFPSLWNLPIKPLVSEKIPFYGHLLETCGFWELKALKMPWALNLLQKYSFGVKWCCHHSSPLQLVFLQGLGP